MPHRFDGAAFIVDGSHQATKEIVAIGLQPRVDRVARHALPDDAVAGPVVHVQADQRPALHLQRPGGADLQVLGPLHGVDFHRDGQQRVIDCRVLVAGAVGPAEAAESPGQFDGVAIDHQPFALLEEVAVQLFDGVRGLPLLRPWAPSGLDPVLRRLGALLPLLTGLFFGLVCSAVGSCPSLDSGGVTGRGGGISCGSASAVILAFSASSSAMAGAGSGTGGRSMKSTASQVSSVGRTRTAG